MSLAAFVFLVAIPIWSVATVITRRIEAWANETDDAAMDTLIGATGEMSQRVAALESVLKHDKHKLSGV